MPQSGAERKAAYVARRRGQVTETQALVPVGQEEENHGERTNDRRQQRASTHGSSESNNCQLGSTTSLYVPKDQKHEHNSISVTHIQVGHDLVRRPEYLGCLLSTVTVIDLENTPLVSTDVSSVSSDVYRVPVM